MKKILFAICLVIFCLSSGTLAYHYYNRYTNNKISEDLSNTYVDNSSAEDTNSTDSTNTTNQDTNTTVERQPKYSIDFASLQSQNSDIAGWIIIEDSPINYPILHCDNNDFYLKHNAFKEYSVSGSIFMDVRNSIDFSNYNTILYGHNMKDNSMFASIRNYVDQSYYNNHKYVYILSPNKGEEIYEVFSAYETPSTSSSYTLNFDSESFKSYVNSCLKQSVITSDFTPAENSNVITLSTCTTGDNRFVIHCAKIS